LRPFVKVGESSESIKIFKFYLKDTKEDANCSIKFEENGPEKSSLQNIINNRKFL
jgi:hypothetical protein